MLWMKTPMRLLALTLLPLPALAGPSADATALDGAATAGSPFAVQAEATAAPVGHLRAAPAHRYQLPVPSPPRLLTAFRPPAQRWGAGHRGVDLAGEPGLPIRAAGAGTVAFAGMLAGREVISIRHTTSLRTTYEPVRPVVHAGQRVSAGEVIGTLEAGHPTCSPDDCLHWGARLGADHYLDPMALLTGWRVRLKPWDD